MSAKRGISGPNFRTALASASDPKRTSRWWTTAGMFRGQNRGDRAGARCAGADRGRPDDADRNVGGRTLGARASRAVAVAAPAVAISSPPDDGIARVINGIIWDPQGAGIDRIKGLLNPANRLQRLSRRVWRHQMKNRTPNPAMKPANHV